MTHLRLVKTGSAPAQASAPEFKEPKNITVRWQTHENGFVGPRDPFDNPLVLNLVKPEGGREIGVFRPLISAEASIAEQISHDDIAQLEQISAAAIQDIRKRFPNRDAQETPIIIISEHNFDRIRLDRSGDALLMTDGQNIYLKPSKLSLLSIKNYSVIRHEQLHALGKSISGQRMLERSGPLEVFEGLLEAFNLSMGMPEDENAIGYKGSAAVAAGKWLIEDLGEEVAAEAVLAGNLKPVVTAYNKKYEGTRTGFEHSIESGSLEFLKKLFKYESNLLEFLYKCTQDNLFGESLLEDMARYPGFVKQQILASRKELEDAREKFKQEAREHAEKAPVPSKWLKERLKEIDEDFDSRMKFKLETEKYEYGVLASGL